MSVPVRYYCPRCGAVATLERDAYLDDKSVTPYPLEGWEYAAPGSEFEDADGVRLTCGEHTGEGDGEAKATWDGAATAGDGSAVEAPCGEPFYLNFVRFVDGEEVEAAPESDYVSLGVGRRADGPRVPNGRGGPDAGDDSGGV